MRKLLIGSLTVLALTAFPAAAGASRTARHSTPLTNFGTVSFSGTTVNGLPIGNFNPDRIDMVSRSTLKAQTGGLSGATEFSVTWKHS